MSELVVPNEPTRVVVGVCGEQASGKTVFLTCVFQSIWTAVSDDLMIDFDRKEVGNAIYFQSIEEELIRRGPAGGTRLLFPARIYLKPYATAPGVPRPVLSVDILDFAGGHFRSIADLKHRLEDSEADPEEAKALREVNEALEHANAFIVLINSREIDPDDETPQRNPFSPSVNFILGHCRAERKPVALLFSQVDQTPALTDEVLHEIPRVRQFEQHFTDDLAEAVTAGGRPYGVVRRIACYETTADGITPRKQGEGGNIWRPEPAEIVLDLIRAALPEILERVRLAAEKVDRDRADAERAELRRKHRQWFTATAAIVAALLVVVMLAAARSRRAVTRQVQLLQTASERLRAGDFASVVPLATEVTRIINVHRDQPENTSEAVRNAIADLHTAAAEAAERLLAEPSLHPDYRENITQFATLAVVVAPEGSDDLQRSLLPVLTARRDFLAGWPASRQMSRRQRARELNNAARRFEQSGDRRFSELLTQEATRTKKAEVSAWQTLIEADPDVETRLATIQNLAAAALEEAEPEPDPEFTHLARVALLGHVTDTILKRSENALLREKLVIPLLPELAQFGDGEVRFDVLARDLLNCAGLEQCTGRRTAVQAAATDVAASVERWRSAVENLLRSLVLDLPHQERREIWNAVAASLTASYFFSGRRDAWPDGVFPLHARIAAVANADMDGTMELIERLSQRPIYAEELDYLNDRLAATEIRRRVVPIYSSILGALAAPTNLLPYDELTRASAEVSSSLSGRPASGSVANLTGEMQQILELVQSVNNLRARGTRGDAITPARLEHLLRDARRQHCGALLSYHPPTECSDAA